MGGANFSLINNLVGDVFLDWICAPSLFTAVPVKWIKLMHQIASRCERKNAGQDIPLGLSIFLKFEHGMMQTETI